MSSISDQNQRFLSGETLLTSFGQIEALFVSLDFHFHRAATIVGSQGGEGRQIKQGTQQGPMADAFLVEPTQTKDIDPPTEARGINSPSNPSLALGIFDPIFRWQLFDQADGPVGAKSFHQNLVLAPQQPIDIAIRTNAGVTANDRPLPLFG